MSEKSFSLSPVDSEFNNIEESTSAPTLESPETASTEHEAFIQVQESAVPSTIEHARFHFADGSLRFIVQNTKYSIHRCYLESHGPNHLWTRDFDADEPHRKLKNVTMSEMDALLNLFYPSSLRRCDVSNQSDWTSVLRLATRWGFFEARELAIEKLDELASPLDKLVLAHEVDIPEWIEPAYASLSTRSDPLTLAEAKRIPLEDVVRIYTAQHRSLTASWTPVKAQDPVAAPGQGFNFGGAPPLQPFFQQPVNKVEVPSLDALPQALELKRYSFAVKCVPIGDTTDEAAATDMIIKWANTPVSVRGDNSLKSCIQNICHRAVYERAFIPLAIRLLSNLKGRILPHVIDTMTPQFNWPGLGTGKRGKERAGTAIVSSQLQDISKGILLACISRNKTSSYLYEHPARTVADGEFNQRLTNATEFLGQLLCARLVPANVVSGCLDPGLCSTVTACEYLRTFGPILDVPESRSELHDILHAHDAALSSDLNDDASMSGRQRLQELHELRGRNWTQEHSSVS